MILNPFASKRFLYYWIVRRITFISWIKFYRLPSSKMTSLTMKIPGFLIFLSRSRAYLIYSNKGGKSWSSTLHKPQLVYTQSYALFNSISFTLQWILLPIIPSLISFKSFLAFLLHRFEPASYFFETSLMSIFLKYFLNKYLTILNHRIIQCTSFIQGDTWYDCSRILFETWCQLCALKSTQVVLLIIKIVTYPRRLIIRDICFASSFLVLSFF